MIATILSLTLIAADQQAVSIDHYKNGHDKVVIIAHGFFNSKDAVLLKELGAELADEYDVIIMDFRGHGKSPGLFHWTTKEYLDLEAVIDYSRKSYKKVGVIGFSLGAATSLITASRGNTIDSVIAVSPPIAFGKIEYWFWQLDIENDIFYNLVGQGRHGKGVRPGPFWLKKDKPIECVERISSPVFYIHGEADWLIKPWHSEALYKKTNSQKSLAMIKKGPHAEYLIRKNKEEVMGLIKEWFAGTM